MKIECNVAGITFRNQDKIFETMIPNGFIEFIHEPKNEYDPNAVGVWYEGTQLGYVKRDSYAQEFLKGHSDIGRAEITGFAYATGSGDAMVFNDELQGKLSSVKFMISHGDDDVVMDEDNNYVIDGTPYSRVTHTLSYLNPEPENSGLDRWKINNFQTYREYMDELNRLAKAGTEMHSAIEEALKTKQDNILVPGGFWNFMNKFEPKILEIEGIVRNDTLRVAGRFDLLCEINGELVVVDWKSSKKPSMKQELQCGYYASEKKAKAGWIVCFGASNKQGYSLRKVTDIERSVKAMGTACFIRDLFAK